MPNWTLYEGDCLEAIRELPDNSVDAIVTDPPYGLSREPDIEEVLRHWLAGDDYNHRGGGFMGKTWDSFVPGPAVWREVCRVVKPGGHILCFAGTRTVDLMGISLRLGGFEIRDCLQWLYGSGFPKSHDISKAIDKREGYWRGKAGKKLTENGSMAGGNYERSPKGEPVTALAKQWEGWGTALKPANEPIVLARKPLSEKTIAENVMKWGTGGLNIDGCRIGTDIVGWGGRPSRGYSGGLDTDTSGKPRPVEGRFPANVILDEEAGKLLDEQSGISRSTVGKTRAGGRSGGIMGKHTERSDKDKPFGYSDSGGASRFFYCAKASKKERGEGNNHPTVKPVKLIEYLITLITPPGGIVLDPFAGSGTTLLAAVQEGFSAIGIEREPEYCEIIRKRMAAVQQPLPLTK